MKKLCELNSQEKKLKYCIINTAPFPALSSIYDEASMGKKHRPVSKGGVFIMIYPLQLEPYNCYN